MSFVAATARPPHGFHEAAQATFDSAYSSSSSTSSASSNNHHHHHHNSSTSASFPDANHHMLHHHHHHHHHARPSNATGAMTDPLKNSSYSSPSLPPGFACDPKPRLTKEQHDILEAHFLHQNKPNTEVKKSFAEALNVSLEKVNNWFQNRRAKHKQDAKKHSEVNSTTPQDQTPPPPAETTASRQPPALNSAESSDVPSLFNSSDYFGLLQQQQQHPDEQLSGGPTTAAPTQAFAAHPSSSSSDHAWSYLDSATLDHLTVPHAFGQDMFENAQDMNRRTLTQEQFDAFAQNAGMVERSDEYHSDINMLHQFFPDMDLKPSPDDLDLTLYTHVAPPLSSHDSSIPSSISEQSMFPSTTSMQDFSSVSTTSSSDWTDSRSSSVSDSHGHEAAAAAFAQANSSSQAPVASSAQWQPGQSIPIDPTAQIQQFREAAQARLNQPQSSSSSSSEQPLVWPRDEALPRRESQSSTLLTQQMSNFALQTPAPQQDGTFKAPPPPPASIATRRQRPRPAALGLASLRSQSYSGAAPAASPGPSAAAAGQAHSSQAPQLRRIRSSNVVNGIAAGRVMKSTPGSAQRSPLNWTFTDALVSPKALRHASSGSVSGFAPPTPMSPRDTSGATEQARPPFPPWQSSFTRHASISETDDEHNVPLPTTSGMPQNFASPPHTPMYQQHQQHQQQHHHNPSATFVHSTISNGNMVTENTPPQSAPAAQQTFPPSAYMPPPPPMAAHPQQAGPFIAPPHHAFQMPAAPYVAPSPVHAHGLPMQFGNGLPFVDALGHMNMAFPPHMQFMAHLPPGAAPPQHLPHAGPSSVNFVTLPHSQPMGGSQGAPLAPKPAEATSELFVHEYTPPKPVKKTPPRQDGGPKSYTFTNQGPTDFEKEKGDKARKTGLEAKSSAAASDSRASGA